MKGAMTGKQRMLTAMRNREPDMVPVAPDMSNMIPCRLTGKPFWDIYLYQDPPLWRAYIEAVKHFGIDGWLPDCSVELEMDREARAAGPGWKEAIVQRTPERIYTRMHANVDGREVWSDTCTVYYVADPPTCLVPPSKVGLPDGPPTIWEDVTPRTTYTGADALHAANELMGDSGVVGLGLGLPGLQVYLGPEAVYEYYDDPSAVIERCEREHDALVRRTREYLDLRPDFILIGVSGHMIGNPEPIFRQLSLKTLQAITALAKQADVPTQVHCCGPEYTFVKIAAEESDLSSINPLEHPPMGDCDLAKVKKEFGHKISLMGNLHTTDVMLHGSPDDVKKAAREAMNAAAQGGGYILSTGDQCGRDTPDENIHALVEVARTEGVY